MAEQSFKSNYPGSRITYGRHFGNPRKVVVDPHATISGDPAIGAIRFLLDNASLFNIPASVAAAELPNLKLVRNNFPFENSKEGFLHFIQTYDGIEIISSGINFAFDEYGDLKIIVGEYYTDPSPVNQVLIDPETAVEVCHGHFGKETEAAFASELKIDYVIDEFLHVWKVKLIGELDERTYIVDAESAEILGWKSDIRHTNGKGYVFKDDPYNPSSSAETRWKENDSRFSWMQDLELISGNSYYPFTSSNDIIHVYNEETLSVSNYHYDTNDSYFLYPRWNEQADDCADSATTRKKICTAHSYNWAWEVMDDWNGAFGTMSFPPSSGDPLIILVNSSVYGSSYRKNGIPNLSISADRTLPAVTLGVRSGTCNTGNNYAHLCTRTATLLHEMIHYVQDQMLDFILNEDWSGYSDPNMCVVENGHIDEASAMFLSASFWYEYGDYSGESWDYDQCTTPATGSGDLKTFTRSQIRYSSADHLAVYPWQTLLCDSGTNPGTTDHDQAIAMVQTLADWRWGVDIGDYDIPSSGCTLTNPWFVHNSLLEAMALYAGRDVNQPELMDTMLDLVIDNVFITSCQAEDLRAAIAQHGLDTEFSYSQCYSLTLSPTYTNGCTSLGTNQIFCPNDNTCGDSDPWC